MKKLRLNLDSLRVDSFQTAPLVWGHGTVRPNESLEPEPDPVVESYECWGSGVYTCYNRTCGGGCGGGGGGTYYQTCRNTCANTCDVCIPDEG